MLNKILIYTEITVNVVLKPYDLERIKKISKTFKSNVLSITLECNLTVTNFLNVTFEIKSAIYYSDRKPSHKLLHINKYSSHPPSIINQIPSMFTNQISEIKILW